MFHLNLMDKNTASKEYSIQEDKFYMYVSSWIKSYRNPDGLHWLRKFIDNSDQSVTVKMKLHQEIYDKLAGLKQTPNFQDKGGTMYLVDSEGQAKVFTTRFSAVCKTIELIRKGYDVEYVQGSVFYRIRLNSIQEVECYELVK